MEKYIYIQLLDEGTKVFRPVLSSRVNDNIYKVGDSEKYDFEDEIWEFIPRTLVVVEEQELEGEIVLVAIKEYSSH